MHPMRLITYALLTGVASLVAMGGIGFYVGYSAGRGDLSELKTLIAAGGSPENAQALAELIKKQGSEPSTPPAKEVDLSPVLNEIRTMSAQIGKLEQKSNESKSAERLSEKLADDPASKRELGSVKLLLAEANNQYQSCKQNLTTLQTKYEELKTSSQAQQTALTTETQPVREGGSVVLFDNVLLKRDQNKSYNDVDVSLSLQSIASRSVKVAVNQQTVGLSFGERKIFQHGDVTCELVLMETDLEGGKARFSIACKR
jgi:hypothetical protein